MQICRKIRLKVLGQKHLTKQGAKGVVKTEVNIGIGTLVAESPSVPVDVLLKTVGPGLEIHLRSFIKVLTVFLDHPE